MLIGENIKKIRLNSTKYSQQEMADFLDVDRNTYANWEKGENDIKSEYIPKLAELLGVSIETLFNPDKNNSVHIIQKHNEGKDSSILNGAVIVITEKKEIDKLVDVIRENILKN